MIFIPLSVIAIMFVLLVICIILISKRKKNKIFGLLCMITSLLLPAIAMSFCVANLTPGGQNLNYLRLPVLISFLIGITNVILSFIIIPNGKSVENPSIKEVDKEKKKAVCSDCGTEPEVVDKVFAGQTEKLIIGLGRRKWFRVISHFNVTYKCPNCNKTWTTNEKEETGKKVKYFDSKTRTWMDTDI